MRKIDADALIAKLKELEWITDDNEDENNTNILEDIINEQPTLEE